MYVVIILLMKMRSGGGQGGGLVGVHILVSIICLLFIVNCVRGDSLIMCWGLGSNSIGYSEEDI